MAKIIATRQADDELDKMLRDLSRAVGIPTAIKYFDELNNIYRRLIDHPESGAPRPELGTGIRIAPLVPYIIAYRYNRRTDTISILRIVHGRRRVKPLP